MKQNILKYCFEPVYFILQNTHSSVIDLSLEDEFLKITQCYVGSRPRKRVNDDQALYFECDLS